MTRDTLAGAGFEELKLRFYGKLIELEMREGDTLALCRAHLAKANTPSLLTLEDGRWQVCYYLFLEKNIWYRYWFIRFNNKIYKH